VTLPRRQRALSFPGDRIEKRAARLLVYKHALAAPIQGHAVTLAGTDPEPEIVLMRDYLKWPAHRAWFVDNSLRPEVVRALNRISRVWPEANVERINLRNIVPKLGAVGFANLDFMGAPLQEETVACLEEVAPRMLRGGILGFTWMRGREHIEGHPASARLWKWGKGFRGNERRWAGVIRFVDHVSNNTLKLIDKYEYLSNHSPMSVAIFKKG
jgi:hypothetical protein